MVENKLYTWHTTKTEKGFKFSVEELTPRKTPNKKGQYVDVKQLNSGLFGSRDKAKRMAQKWVRFFKNKKNVEFTLKQ